MIGAINMVELQDRVLAPWGASSISAVAVKLDINDQIEWIFSCEACSIFCDSVYLPSYVTVSFYTSKSQIRNLFVAAQASLRLGRQGNQLEHPTNPTHPTHPTLPTQPTPPTQTLNCMIESETSNSQKTKVGSL